MLVPPSSSDLLACTSTQRYIRKLFIFTVSYIAIDPTKLTKGRQFARTAAPSRNVDNSLWTETPAERQQRLADEVAGKRRRAVNADPDAGDESKEAESRKKRRRDEEIRKGVDEYTVRLIIPALQWKITDMGRTCRKRTEVAHCWISMGNRRKRTVRIKGRKMRARQLYGSTAGTWH